ncbi:MAG: hypothetical protein H0W88_05390 [Parachlamydiaceae bacterium]|nr:hypothetical protein [Parachlamydiaceae bacterium]
MRGNFISVLAPLWEKIATFKAKSTSTDLYQHENGTALTPKDEINRLQLENQLLTNELINATKLIADKQALDRHLAELANLAPTALPTINSSYQAYINRLKNIISFKVQALPARIIFRSLGTWNSSFWINVGETDNKQYSTKIVAKNSPVLSGNSIIGVIDYVGTNQSRVCLITDPRLAPSVRAVRGGEQDFATDNNVDSLLKTLQNKKTIIVAEDDRQVLVKLLSQVKETLQPSKKTWYLAKGELQGSVRSSGRVQNQILKGSGFNFDFSDAYGDARDLRTGRLLNDNKSTPIPILKVHDILVTTGLDGIFPPNLQVAIIEKIELLKEGDYYYELEARPMAGNLNELSLVLVIPPLNQIEENERNISIK